MSLAQALVCDDCGRRTGIDAPHQVCPACGGLLEVAYDLRQARRELDPERLLRRTPSVWRWRELLPVLDPAHEITLGEGGTPLVRSITVGAEIGLKELYFKNDTVMPTGSFKDRGFAVAVARARELGQRRGFTYSSGNAAASLAAYARRAALDVALLVESDANPTKVAQVAAYGFPVITLRFENFTEIDVMMERATRETSWCQFVNFLNPYRHEAMKTIAYEVARDLAAIRGRPGFAVPDMLVQPVGTGGGIHGAAKGFEELLALGWTERVPRLVGVQPASTGYLQEAFAAGRDHALPRPGAGSTIAQSIAANAPLKGGRRALAAIYRTGGSAETATEAQILEAVLALGREGILAEPAAAAPLAAVMAMARAGRLDPEASVVCVVTGSGLKDPGALATALDSVPRATTPLSIHADLDELAAALGALWARRP